MKKIISFIIIFSILISFYSLEAKSKSEETYFVVTAYYSPLPDQKYYLRGNYIDEKILNGEGIRGASGRGVYSGMLAAPKNYTFGTKIFLEGLGIGTVEDRGGAIVNAGNRGYENDRIDVWMGYGDEGLQRALYWGKRKVKGKILSRESTDSIDISKVPSPNWAINSAKKAVITKSVFDINIGKQSHKGNIAELQTVLKDLELYSGENTGKYDKNTVSAVYDFQVMAGILKNEYDYGAGYYGPKTRKALKSEYTKYLEKTKAIEEERKRIEKEKIEEEKRIYTLKKEAETESQDIMKSIGTPVFGGISPGVRELQINLKKLGYFNTKDTAIYGNITKKAIFNFQKENGLVSKQSDLGAGVFGPKTRKLFELKLSEKIFSEKNK